MTKETLDEALAIKREYEQSLVGTFDGEDIPLSELMTSEDLVIDVSENA